MKDEKVLEKRKFNHQTLMKIIIAVSSVLLLVSSFAPLLFLR